MRILVVEDEEMKRLSLESDLAAWGHQVTSCGRAEEALRRLEDSAFDVLVADLKLPGLSGMDLLRRVRARPGARCQVVMITAYGSIPVAVEAMREGAFDFVTKPFPNEQLRPILERIEGAMRARLPAGPAAQGSAEARWHEAPAAQSAERAASGPSSRVRLLVGGSAAMDRVRELVAICARSDANVLITGETGTGKDLVASCIHKSSVRHASPFVKVSCAVFPRELISSELYGHEKGAFTGADRSRTGRFDLAEGGTLYLDDVDDIPLDEQVKLLRVIEERVYERVGGSAPVRADVRVIASTKKELMARIQEGSFREDLYYRLNVMRIDLAPLRERREDIGVLAAHLLQEISGKEKVAIDPEVLGILNSHAWPGNIRELRNTLERAFLTGGGAVTGRELLLHIGQEGAADAGRAFRERVDGFERDLLLRALRANGGNKTAAARFLGMKPSTFRDKLDRYGL